MHIYLMFDKAYESFQMSGPRPSGLKPPATSKLAKPGSGLPQPKSGLMQPGTLAKAQSKYIIHGGTV